VYREVNNVRDIQHTHPQRTQRKNREKPRQLEPRSPRIPHRTHQTNRTNKRTQRNRNPSRKKKNKNRLRHPNPRGPRTPKLILDSNIIAKLVLNEPDSNQARAKIKTAIKKGTALYTADLALTECLNIIWKHTTLLKDIQDPNTVLEDLLSIYDRLTIIPTRTIAEETINIANAKKITVYDATYIALTQKLNGTLYTADKKLATITKSKLLKSN
jgi:predicted nucleic acid-binding protein